MREDNPSAILASCSMLISLVAARVGLTDLVEIASRFETSAGAADALWPMSLRALNDNSGARWSERVARHNELGRRLRLQNEVADCLLEKLQEN